MQIVKITALENGAHENQTYHGVLPEGWAVIPDELQPLENFPFGEVTVEGDVVTSWTPGVMPEPEPEPEPEEPTTELTDAEMAEAIREGVNAI